MESINYFIKGPSACPNKNFYSNSTWNPNFTQQNTNTQETVTITKQRISGNTVDSTISFEGPSKETRKGMKAFWESRALIMFGIGFGFLFIPSPVTYLISFCAFYRFCQGMSQYESWTNPHQKVAQMRSEAKLKGFSHILHSQEKKFPFTSILTNTERNNLYKAFFAQFNTQLTSKKLPLNKIFTDSPLQSDAMELASLTEAQKTALEPLQQQFNSIRNTYQKIIGNQMRKTELTQLSQNQKVPKSTLKTEALTIQFNALQDLHQKAFKALGSNKAKQD